MVGRGHRKLSWRIRLRDAWVSAVEWPEARIEQVEPGPGTVWERRIVLLAPRGTELERVDSRPAASRRRSVLEHLARSRRNAGRQVTRTRYRVEAGARVVRTKA